LPIARTAEIVAEFETMVERFVTEHGRPLALLIVAPDAALPWTSRWLSTISAGWLLRPEWP